MQQQPLFSAHADGAGGGSRGAFVYDMDMDDAEAVGTSVDRRAIPWVVDVIENEVD
jgi:hypothetical protein